MNAPPEGSDTMRGGRVEKTPRSHVCGFIFFLIFLQKIKKKKKREAVAFSQSDRTRAVWCRGAGGVFSLTNSRLMQKKKKRRASLNIQQEKLQSQQSIWPPLLFGTTSFHSSAPSLPSYSSTLMIFFIPAFFFCILFLAALTFTPLA